MKVYIVYRGEFEKSYPECYMSRPEILLVTTDKSKALQEIEDIKQEISNNDKIKNIYENGDGFEYDNGFDTYGSVDIIEEELKI